MYLRVTGSLLPYVATLLLLCTTACATQRVFVRAPQQAAQVVLADQAAPVSSGRASIEVPQGIGPVPYSVYDSRGNLLDQGQLARTKRDPLITSMSIVGTVIAVPVLAFTGVLVANPSWWAAFSNVSQTPGGNLRAFLANSMSTWTLPVATIFGALGLLPLLGLLKSEKLPDEVVVGSSL